MKKRALVGVIMPSFNSEKYIATAIRSVLEGTFRNFELIVVDGGSRDRTLKIVRDFGASDPRVRLILNQDDRGPAHARAAGVRACRAKYVAFLDADDCWRRTKLEAQVHFMEEKRLDFTYTLYRHLSDDGQRTSGVVPLIRASYGFRQALCLRGIGTLTVMVRRELLSEDVLSAWRRDGGEEMLWWLTVLRKGARAWLLPQDLAFYRDTDQSLSKRRIHTLRSVWEIYRKDLGLGWVASSSCYASYFVDSGVRNLLLVADKRWRSLWVQS
jgi:teichuronic acid biosynthesis glycosyltransferase TuaG